MREHLPYVTVDRSLSSKETRSRRNNVTRKRGLEKETQGIERAGGRVKEG